ncbi:predicted protein [Naegleria gruberi]|uniref:Predicted protein n=1 Tax=Naegleria gruberi TaxID=5762 RepID=D2VHA3_NAEGR|nr:uncharacterized protein NAEGRDRAFT_68143 [Naegleria gruberi]EFC43765.1 predicted protein [Naegleria gruberi]|eukprot:XP_002676509.1 predicted protein [Naegleria gruberi strain NEG-M]
MRRKLNPVVDIHSIFNNSNGEKEHMLGSGFIVSPPSSKEVYIFTCFHNVSGFRKNGIWYNNESVYVLLDPDRSQRPNFTVEHYCKCEIVETGSVLENELLTDHPQEDWALLKTSTELLLEEDPNFFFIPSPSNVSELQSKEEKTYSVCLQSIPSRVQELDMNTHPCNVNINMETICQYIEFDVKSASFGRGRGGDEGVSFYDSVSFKGSSGGAVTTCNQHYEDWSLFKEKIELSNRVVGIHIGAENFGKVDCSNHVNRCCSVKNWFQCYLSKVYDPLREHFSQAFQELVESERYFFNKN